MIALSLRRLWTKSPGRWPFRLRSSTQDHASGPEASSLPGELFLVRESGVFGRTFGTRPLFQHVPLNGVEFANHRRLIRIRVRQFDAMTVGIEEVDRMK